MSATEIGVHRNIVYATASRFSPPQLLDRVTTRPGPVQCPQVPGLLEQAMGTGEIPMSEDCLTLDVYAPTGTAGGLPVLVWIHGGAFTNGTAHASWYDGSNLARRGCVVVGINYRLGAFGFTGSADLGLLDQITALQWVHDNIGSFGGDAANVTIFGESAGGCSVLALMAAPRAAGLFQRAWSMSPSIGQLRSTARAEQSRRLLGSELGVANEDPARYDTLLALTTDEIVAAQSRLFRDPKDIVTMFSPTIGGDLLPIDTHARIASDPRPLVIGTMRDESRLWVAMNPLSAQLTVDDVLEQFTTRFGSQADRAWQVYSQARPNSTPAEMLAALQSDESFRVPAWRVIDSRDEAGGATWSYFFSWPTPVFDGILGACHGLDIPFVFDNLTAANVEFFIGASPAHRHLADTLADSLARFAREGTVGWQTTSRNRTTLQIDETNRVCSDPERAVYDLWNDRVSSGAVHDE